MLNASLMLAVVETVLFSYFCIYVLGHEEWVAPLYTLGSLASIVVAAVLPSIGRRLTKRTMIAMGCGFLLCSAAVCVFTTTFPWAIVFVLCKGIGYGLTISCCGILWTSTADHIERESGIAVPGMVMASGSFVQKILMGLATFIGTMVLALGGYNQELTMQSQSTLIYIRAGIVIFLALAAVAALAADMCLTELQEDLNEKENWI